MKSVLNWRAMQLCLCGQQSNSVTPVGWLPFSQALVKVVELKIPIFV
jgi:hypothetical protein